MCVGSFDASSVTARFCREVSRLLVAEFSAQPSFNPKLFRFLFSVLIGLREWEER